MKTSILSLFLMLSFLQTAFPQCSYVVLSSSNQVCSSQAPNSSYNCHQYVKAYLAGQYSGDWVPTSYNYVKPCDFSTSKISTDPNFVLLTDPDQYGSAHAVEYSCDHSAVIINSTCLISKQGNSGELARHSVSGAGCTSCGKTYIKYYKYVGNSRNYSFQACILPSDYPPTCPTSATISGTYHRGGSPSYTLNTTNYLSAGNVYVSVSTSPSVPTYVWTKTGGSGSFYLSNGNKNLQFYLATSSSMSFNLKVKNSCGTVIAEKNYAFIQSGSQYSAFTSPELASSESEPSVFVSQGSLSDQVSIYPNPAQDVINFNFHELSQNKIVFINPVGEEVMKIESGNNLEAIDISCLSKGVYLIKIISEDRHVMSKRLVVD